MPVDWTKEISASLSCCTASTKSDRILFVLQKCLRERERESFVSVCAFTNSCQNLSKDYLKTCLFPYTLRWWAPYAMLLCRATVNHVSHITRMCTPAHTSTLCVYVRRVHLCICVSESVQHCVVVLPTVSVCQCWRVWLCVPQSVCAWCLCPYLFVCVSLYTMRTRYVQAMRSQCATSS